MLIPEMGLAVETQGTRNPTGGVLSIPRTSPRADAFFQILHDLCGDAAVRIFSFGGVLHCLFLLQNEFFLRETRDGFEGVQWRGPVKGAVCPRSSKTLDREHRWNSACFQRSGLSEEKMGQRRLPENTEVRLAEHCAARFTAKRLLVLNLQLRE
jgi:hypothetical protein